MKPLPLAVAGLALLAAGWVLLQQQPGEPERLAPPPERLAPPPEPRAPPPEPRAPAEKPLAPAEERPAPAAASEPVPVFGKGPCLLQLHQDGRWVDRAHTACGEDGTVRLLVAGDVGLPGASLDATVAGATAFCEAEGCDLLLIPGDLVYGPGAGARVLWPKVWDGGLARLGLPALAVLGNHEWRDYRTEPNPELKREVVFASDGRAGLVLPAPTWTARLLRDGEPLLAFAGLDTDVLADPRRPQRPVGEEELARACGLGVPVVALGHHPPTSQGLHHEHEQPVERAVQDLLLAAPEACTLALFAAGHDHDLQSYPSGCEREGLPPVVVSGVAGKGFRPPGPQHLPTCLDGERRPAYHAGPSPDGGFAHVVLSPEGTTVRLLRAADGSPEPLSEQRL